MFDLVSKYGMFAKFASMAREIPPRYQIEVIPGVVRFEKAENTGAAWGMFSQAQFRWVLAGLSAIALPVILGYYLKMRSPSWMATIGLSLIAAGTLGNLYDRLLFGHVRDFIYFHIINFPVFNVADSCICIGAALFALESLFVAPKTEASAAKA